VTLTNARRPSVRVLDASSALGAWAVAVLDAAGYPGAKRIDAADVLVWADTPGHSALGAALDLPYARRRQTVVVTDHVGALRVALLNARGFAAVVEADPTLLQLGLQAARDRHRYLPRGPVRPAVGPGARDFTRTEAEVVVRLALGQTAEEIAAATGTKPKTVNAHVSNVLRGVGLPTRTALVAAVHAGG